MTVRWGARTWQTSEATLEELERRFFGPSQGEAPYGSWAIPGYDRTAQPGSAGFPVLVSAASGQRKSLSIQNRGPGSVFIGYSDKLVPGPDPSNPVTTANAGMEILARGVAQVDQDTTQDVYLIGAVGAPPCDVRTAEFGSGG